MGYNLLLLSINLMLSAHVHFVIIWAYVEENL